MNPEQLKRFDAMVVMDPTAQSDCWLWVGKPREDGYAQFNVGRPRLAHRVAYEHWREPIPDGLVIDHLCRVRACVNPAHLEPVTQRTNVLRGVSPAVGYAQRTECPKGHSLADHEARMVYGVKKGRRCRRCHADYEYARRRRVDTA